MCENTVNTCTLMLDCVLDCYKIEKMCEKSVFEKQFMLKNCLNRYKIQGMCKNAVDACLPALIFVPDTLVTSRSLRDNVVCFDIVLASVNLNNVNLYEDK